MVDSNHTYPWNAGSECRKHWRTYLITGCVAFALAILVTASIPREYAGRVTIADENKETDLMIGLSNMQAWLKTAMELNMGYKNIKVYTQHVTSRSFAEEMSRVQLPGHKTDYGHYLRRNHRRPWWEKIFTPDDDVDIIGLIADNIKTEVSLKFSTLRLQVTDQDPVVAAMLVDSALTRLERFVSEEQHKLATQLKRNYAILKERAEKHYREAQQRYTEYMDSHRETSLWSETIEEKSLEKEYDKAYDAYRQSCLQYLRADALTNKPVIPFAVVKNATVQQEASSPIFMGYLLSFLAIAFIASSWFILLRKKYHIWKGGVSS